MIIAAEPDMEMVAQASTAEEALQEYRRTKPDVILMDQRLPGASGTEALIAIRSEFPHARIMMLTTSSGDIEIQRALRAGATAYVLKSTPKNEMLRIIRTVSTGRKAYSVRRRQQCRRAHGAGRPHAARAGGS